MAALLARLHEARRDFAAVFGNRNLRRLELAWAFSIVATDGTTSHVRVISGLGMGLDEKAIEAVKTWKFRPAMKDGKPVATQIAVVIEFKLR